MLSVDENRNTRFLYIKRYTQITQTFLLVKTATIVNDISIQTDKRSGGLIILAL